MMSRRGAIWDMDGVLVDTGELHYQTWFDTLADYGILLSREQFRATFGMNNRGILTIILGRAPDPDFLEEVSQRTEGHFRQLVRDQGVEALPGVLDWLQRLHTAGYRQAIASSAPRANIDTLVDVLRVRGFFESIVSGYHLPGKPDPATFLQAADEIGVEPARCVVVEDAVAGVEAAHRAGMACIAVTTTNPADRLREAQMVVDSLDDLPPDAFDSLLAQGGE
jgi:beta-phosphoglucomutase